MNVKSIRINRIGSRPRVLDLFMLVVVLPFRLPSRSRLHESEVASQIAFRILATRVYVA
jgi:hypothetical protein